MMPAQKRALFNELKETLNVEDGPRLIDSLPFFWDNRCYIFNDSMSGDRTIPTYSIRGDWVFSDHHPLFI